VFSIIFYPKNTSQLLGIFYHFPSKECLVATKHFLEFSIQKTLVVIRHFLPFFIQKTPGGCQAFSRISDLENA
jgi:uncharacterized protein Usg